MPARAEEVENAEAEGIELELLTNPIEIFGNEERWVTGMRWIRMELSQPNASDRRGPIPKPGSEFDTEVDAVIVAVGTTPNPLILTAAERLEQTR